MKDEKWKMNAGYPKRIDLGSLKRILIRNLQAWKLDFGDPSNLFLIENYEFSSSESSTGNFFSEALVLESVNPQYDERLFIEFPEKYKFNIVLNVETKTKNNFCTQNVVNLYFSGNSMNDHLSYMWVN